MKESASAGSFYLHLRFALGIIWGKKWETLAGGFIVGGIAVKKTVRMILALLLTMILYVCLIPSAFAEGETVVASGTCGAEGDNLTWTLYDSGELVIDGTGNMANYGEGLAPWYNNSLSLTSITIIEGVKTIGRYAFYNCPNLSVISIPSSISWIGDHAFYHCVNLTNITIPNGVTYLGSDAFNGCSSLTSINIPSNVTSIGNGAFSGCRALTKILVDSGNSFYCDVDGVLCDLGVTRILHFPHGWQGVYKIPSTITSIDSSIFSSCAGLTSVIIPEGISSIDWGAFSNCTGLRSVIIPSTVTTIGGYAFENCVQLSAVCFGGTEEQWQNISQAFFGEELRKANIYYNCTAETTYEIIFNSNNENSTEATQVVPEKTSVALNPNPFTRDGYVFIGWSTAPEGTVEYADGAPITVDDSMILYAQWAEAVTVSFDGNSDMAWFGTLSQIIPKGIPTALEKNTFIHNGYTFKGWGLSSGDKSVDYEDQGLITVNEDITLYAIWEEIEKIGSFSVEGGKSTGFGWTYCVGDTLTASVKTTSPKEYQWKRDGNNIFGATQSTYLVTPEDFLHRISCTVSIPTDTQTSYSVLINTSIEQEIIDDGNMSLPYGAPGVIKGVFPGMTYTLNGGPENTISDSIQNNRLEVTEPGTYVFRYNNLESAPISVDAWYSIGYTVKSNSGSGNVNLMYGNISLTDEGEIREDGKTIIRQYYGKNVPGYCWLVLKDAAPESFNLTVSPFANCYAHVSVNGGEISSYNEQTVIDIGILTAPVLCEMTFTSSPLTPSIIVPIDEANFPDPVFRSFVSSRYDRDGDGMLSDSEIYSVRTLSLSNYTISSLRGVEYFTELTNLNCTSNNLTELDLSGCAVLNTLNCNANALTSLKLDGCTGLRSLNCANNSLRELDVSGCPALETLNCSTNMLSSLDLSSNSALMSLTCSDNYFTLLSLAENPVLNTLTCNDNLLKRLDLTLNPSLVSVICNNNLLTGLDVSDCPNLRTLRCSGNLLTWLDLSGCPSIMTLDCQSNSIETLILDGCTALTSLNCSNNRLQALALDSAASLNSLSCSANQLELLDVSGLGNLTVLNCQSNQIVEIDVSDCGTLRSLNCTNNLLRQLDVTGCYSMKALQCERNLLTALDLGGCEVLKTLYCSNNGLTQLDISDCTALVELVESTEPQERGTTLVYGAYGSFTSSSSSSVPSYSMGLSIDKNVVLIYPSHSIASDPDFVLPSSLTVIEDEAFTGGAFTYVKLPDGAVSIGWHAFADCPNLMYIYIPATTESIDAHAFDGEDRLTIIGVPGSEAETYARLHGFAFTAAE